jgi:antitoxin HigA-1
MLEDKFFKPLGLPKYRLAKSINVLAQRISNIVAGKQSLTVETDLRLCRLFALSEGWWLHLQGSYDTTIARRKIGKVLEKIMPLNDLDVDAKAR